MKTFRVGDLVSVWERSSRRHKWRMAYGFALLMRYTGDGASIQRSESHNAYTKTGWTFFRLSNGPGYCRELRAPVFDMAPNGLRGQDF